MDEEGYNVVYYWEINWPRFFSNRDYCCHRSVQVLKNIGIQWKTLNIVFLSQFRLIQKQEQWLAYQHQQITQAARGPGE